MARNTKFCPNIIAVFVMYTSSLIKATFSSGKKSCLPKIVLSKLKKKLTEIHVSEGISVS